MIVESMRRGMNPAAACLEAAKRVVANSKERRLKGPDGRVLFDLKFYALRRDGGVRRGDALPRGKLAVCDQTGPHTIDAPARVRRPPM
jgi:hypothetical protein